MNINVVHFFLPIAILTLMLPLALQAHTINQKLSSYQDNQGVDQRRIKIASDLSYKHYQTLLTGSSYALSAWRDYIVDQQPEDDELVQTEYQTAARTNDTIALTLAQTWQKITDSRVFSSFSSDRKTHSQSFGFGAGHWFWQETLQLNLDLSQTKVDRPVVEFLDQDSDIISPPARYNSQGLRFKAKHLSTATTISEYYYIHIESNDRPPADSYGFGIRQFISPTKSSIQADIVRAFNRHRVTTKSSYGEVDAWISEIAFLQTLWRGGYTKLNYRYYNEKEVTRSDKDTYIRGTDMFGGFFAQQLDKTIADSMTVPLTMQLGYQRYLTNESENGTKIAAHIYEVGVGATF